jgi:hypothetical protein
MAAAAAHEIGGITALRPLSRRGAHVRKKLIFYGFTVLL